MEIDIAKPNKRFKELLTAHSKKEITLDELLLKCAEWTAEIIDEYQFKPLPARPDEMDILKDIPPSRQSELDRSFYDSQPQILNYVRTYNQIEAENKALHDWLIECRKLLLESGQVESVAKIDKKLGVLHE